MRMLNITWVPCTHKSTPPSHTPTPVIKSQSIADGSLRLFTSRRIRYIESELHTLSRAFRLSNNTSSLLREGVVLE